MDGGRPRGRGRGSDAASTSPTPSTSSTISRSPRSVTAQEPIKTIPEGLLTKVGTEGIPVRLYSNFFKLNTPDDMIVYDYHITITPEVESVVIRRQLVYELRNFFNDSYIFDGGSNVKSLYDTKETRAAVYGDYSFDITPTGPIAWGHPEMMRFYNIQMKRNLVHMGMIRIGRNYYDPSEAKVLEADALDIWPGVLTAVNEHDEGILMVVNNLHKIIRHETALDKLKEIYLHNKKNPRDIARRELPGLIVMTNYNSKTYRVDDVVFDKNPDNYTIERDERTISLKTYYYEAYGLEIQDDSQPLLVVRPNDRQMRGGMTTPIILIPELCLLTGITESMKNDMRLRRDIETHVRLSPVDRMKSLNDFIENMTTNQEVIDEMQHWDLTLTDELTRVTGRLLPSEKILTGERSGSDGVDYEQKTGSFEQYIRSERMRRPVNLEYWAIFATHRDRSHLENYVQELRKITVPLGINLKRPKVFWLENDRIPTYINYFRQLPMDKVQMVNVIVPNSNHERYCAIKRYFTVDAPCPSQIITRRVLDKESLSIMTKILVQMAAKLGGSPWAVVIPPKKTMVVGYNTYRDTSRRGHSVGAFVCSLNFETTSWYSRVNYHKSSEEMSTNFKEHLRYGLKAWLDTNKGFPEKLIIYRDGISEGQIAHVYETEIKKITDLLAERDDLKKTVWSFTIVNKRVNARFFYQPSTNLANPVINPFPGTIVDSKVTRKERYDFYLVSQSVRQGTVNPTMYNIIADNTGWVATAHQIFAYKMCHLYYNWAGTISVPAPCLYAYKLAFLIGTCIHAQPSPSLSQKLHYL